MSTILLTDERQQTTTIHPPDTEDRQILAIPDHAAVQRLPLTDRLSLRLGLWLLQRGLHSGRDARVGLTDEERRVRHENRTRLRGVSEHHALALLTYDPHRWLR